MEQIKNMNWKFWNWKLVYKEDFRLLPPVKISIDEIVKNTEFSEEILDRIDILSVIGTKLVCLEDCGITKGYFINFREYVKSTKSTYYNFNKGGIYQVSYVSNEYVGVRDTNSHRLEKHISFIKNHPSGYPYIFDFFVLESEYLALERDKQINNILE